MRWKIWMHTSAAFWRLAEHMQIHIDASRALNPQPTGVNVYAQEIIEHLVAELRGDDEMILYAPQWLESRVGVVFPELGGRVTWKFLKWPPKFLWTQVCLGWAWLCASRRDRDAVFFAPAHVAPLVSPRNLVVTIHDLAFELLPDAFSWHERIFARLLTRMNAAAARAIIVPSEETKIQLITRYNSKAEKIFVTLYALPRGVSAPATDADAAAVKQKFNVSRPFVLFVGRIEFKKGCDILVRAFEAVRARGTDVDLVLVGKPGTGYDPIKNQITVSPEKNRIHELGFVTNDDVAALYRAASVFALPTRYEGFGFIFLEAMHHGVPVVGMATGSVPEVAGDAALLARTEIEFQESLITAVADITLRQELIQRGFARVKNFDWKRAAKLTMTILCGRYEQ